MIELLVAALLQLATITTDASDSQTQVYQQAQTTTEQPSTEGSDGGTGAWDDNG
ncbi:MAG TPA: hypothetical protein VK927_09155 [Adhaeribacter sp.]|nr:hypothetical protein [Adhaeribacter sp.]